jgi:hypothetical protein
MDAMDIAPRDIPADELQDTIRSVRSNLATAGETPFLRRDPYRLVLAGLGDVLGVFGKSITRWERAVADVIAARDPLPKADRDALKVELITAVEDGAFRGMRKEAQRMLRTFDRAQARNTGLAVGGAFVLGGLSAWALLATLHWGEVATINRALDTLQAAAVSSRPTDAVVWLKLMQNNDITQALAGCADPRSQDGRAACNLPIWLGPAPQPKGK